MKRTEELFSLIHSLNKHEKRFFKLSASIESGEKQYMQMFDIIAHQSVYDEKEILAKLKITKNVLSFQKNYLQRLILNKIASLSSSKRAQVRNLLTQADILFNKGLYSLHHKLLKKAKELAKQNDLNDYLLEISTMEHTLAWRNQQLPEAAKALEEKKENISQLQIEIQYHRLANKIITRLAQLGTARSTKEMQELKKLVNDPLIRNEKKAVTFRCKNLVLHTLSLYHSLAGDPLKEYKYCKKNVELFLANPEKTELSIQNFLFALHTAIHACNRLKRYDQSKYYLDLMQQNYSRVNTEREKIWIFYNFHDNNLDYYIRTGKFKEGVPEVEKLTQALQLEEHKLDKMVNLILYSQIARLYFGAENFSKCIEWLNKILSQEDILRLRPDIEMQIKLFYLIAHFEKGHEDLIPHLTRSLHRYLSSKKRLYKFENILLDYLGKRLFRADSKKEMLDQFKNLKKDLLPLASDNYEKIPLLSFDYLSWIESKIENRKFSEIVKEKSRQLSH